VVPKNTSSSPFYKERQGVCTICSETDSNLVNISKKCVHLANCCVGCLTQSITTDIESKGSYTFRCPMPTCNVKFEPEEYYHLLDKRLIDIVDNLLLHRVLEANEEFKWCKSSKGCGAGQLVSNHKDLLGYVRSRDMLNQDFSSFSFASNDFFLVVSVPVSGTKSRRKANPTHL
jgi:hypothetical protein